MGTILLVDDNLLFLEIEKEFLQNSDVQILTARDGLEVLEIVKTVKPDVIFMDYEMPRMDGPTCCQALRSDRALADIPVVMVTSKGQEEDIERCYSVGCDYYLTKPLDRDVFLSTARNFIPHIDRREKRVLVNLDATLEIRNDRMECRLHDLSAGGAFISTDYFGNLNGVIQISFKLPDETLIDCHGRFAWINRGKNSYPHGIGIKFALMTKDMQEALKKFLSSRS